MRRILLALLVLLAATVLFGGPLTAASDPPAIKWVNAKHIDSIEGADIYAAYCQACHGPTGRGNGPAARAFTTPIPDLTTICERDGRFNVVHVKMHISDRHQHVIMPDWNDVFFHNYGRKGGWADVAALNLANHIEHMQVTMAPR